MVNRVKLWVIYASKFVSSGKFRETAIYIVSRGLKIVGHFPVELSPMPLGTKKLPPLPCKANGDPLSPEEKKSGSIHVKVKHFDIHHKNILDTFPYRLPPGARPDCYFRVSYFEFQSTESAKRSPHLGSPGDVWVQADPLLVKKIFYKVIAGWTEWQSSKYVLESANHHVSGSQYLSFRFSQNDLSAYYTAFLARGRKTPLHPWLLPLVSVRRAEMEDARHRYSQEGRR